MKLAVLDGACLTGKDLSWDGLRRLGEVEVFERTSASEVLPRISEAEVVLTNKTPLRAEVLQQARKLRYIGVLATGFDVVDAVAARAQGITVTNIPSYGTASVAQFVFALLLELCNSVKLHADAVEAGEWGTCLDWSFRKRPLVELAGKTMGIVGFGRIGRQVACIADAFGMHVLATNRSQSEPPNYPGFRFAALEELLRESDVVSLHAPLRPETRELINARTLGMMKPSALLVNTARGGLIDSEALAAALNAGRLGGAGVDVLAVEPPSEQSPLLTARNCIVTPHIAWATVEARTRLMAIAVENVARFLAGQPLNVVN